MISSKKFKKLKGISHGFFNKKGGKSKGIYQSLNCGPGSNDKITNVKKVIDRIKIREILILGKKECISVDYSVYNQHL